MDYQFLLQLVLLAFITPNFMRFRRNLDRIWKTPHKAMITAGLRAAVCDLAIKTSISNTQRGISQRTGERDLLSTRTLLNILHTEGSKIIEAQERRARA